MTCNVGENAVIAVFSCTIAVIFLKKKQDHFDTFAFHAVNECSLKIANKVRSLYEVRFYMFYDNIKDSM